MQYFFVCTLKFYRPSVLLCFIGNSCFICCSLLSFQYFCFLRFLISCNICFKLFTFCKGMHLHICLFEGNRHSAIIYQFLSSSWSHSWAVCHPREMFAKCISWESVHLKYLACMMMQTGLKTGEGGVELSFTCETVKINKWMGKTICSKHIWLSAKVYP